MLIPLIPLIVTLSLVLQVCSAAYNVSFAKLTSNKANQGTVFTSSAIFSNGDVLVGGYTTGIVGFTSAGNNDFLLQRYSYTGSLTWTKVYGTVNSDVFESVSIDASDNIYAVGCTFDSPTNGQAYVAKFNSSGHKIFSTKVGGTAIDSANGVIVDSPSGVFFVTGYTHGPVFSGVALSGISDGFLLRMDTTTGAILTTSLHGVAGYTTLLLSLALDSIGYVWALGFTNAPTYHGKTGKGSYDIIVQKFSSSGSTIVANLVGGTGSDQPAGIAIDTNDNVYMTGGVPAAVDSQTFLGSTDILLTKFNSTGTKLWTKLLGSAGSDTPSDIAVDSTLGRVCITGTLGATTFYGTTTTAHQTPFLLVLNSGDGSYVSSALYSSTGTYNIATTITIRGSAMYMAGYISGNFQGIVNPVGSTLATGFVIKIGSGHETATNPSKVPSAAPSITPSTAPSADPSAVPSTTPSADPSAAPSTTPSADPSAAPSADPSAVPSAAPSADPSAVPSAAPSADPSAVPSAAPSADPSAVPSAAPSADPSFGPSPVPSVTPSFVPTAFPSIICLQWALGDYGESCSTTCSKLSRTCKDNYLKDVLTQEAFYAVVESAVNSRSGGALGNAESFCSLTTESVVTVGAPAALSVVLYSEDHHSPVRTSCSYPTSVPEVTAGCDTILPLRNFRRFCPCVNQGCDGEVYPGDDGTWYLGHSGDSCDATCSIAGGICDAEPLSSVINAAAFTSVVASTVSLETNNTIGASSTEFCQQGINVLPFAPAPVVITLNFGAVNDTLCSYPTDVSNLQGSCDMAFTDPPAQRFCNCKQATAPPQSERRALFTPAAPAVNADPVSVFSAGVSKVTPRLRGNVAALEGLV